MGHTFREMFPKTAEAHDKRLDRLLKLREEIKDLPLSRFTVGDFEALYRLANIGTIRIGMNEQEIARLEKRVKEIKSKRRRK